MEIIHLILYSLLAFILYYVLKPIPVLLYYKLKHGNKVTVYYFPIIGRVWKLNQSKSKFGDILYFKKHSRATNPKADVEISNFIGGQLMFEFSKTDHLKFILQNHTLYAKPQFEFIDLIMSKGVISQSGDAWKEARRFLAKYFEFTHLAKSFNGIKNTTEKYFKDLPEIPNIASQASEIAGEVITKTYFGQDIEKQLNGKDFLKEIYDASMICVGFKRLSQPQVIIRRMLFGEYFKPRPSWSLIQDDKILINRLQNITSSVKNIIEERKKVYQEYDDFLSGYIGELSKGIITEEVIVHQYMTLLFAGMDTTSSLLTACCYALAKYPDIQNIVRAGIKVKVQDFDSLSYEHLGVIPTLNQFINETLRLYTPAPALLFRRSLTDHHIDDYFVPKGVLLIVSFLQNNYDPLKYDDPHQFRLDRTYNQNPFQFIPFSAGARNCIGQHLSLMELKSMLIYLLLHYNITLRCEVTWKSELVYTMDQNDFLRFDKI